MYPPILASAHSRYWLYKMEWETGPNGHLSWYYDNAFVWSMSAASFGAYEVCGDHGGVKECQRTPPRQIPAEPMSLVMNTAIGTWNGGQTALDGKHWPAKFFIDYVRVWQAETHWLATRPTTRQKSTSTRTGSGMASRCCHRATTPAPRPYPKSAYDNAKAIKARGEEKRKLAAAVKLAQSAPNAPTPEQRHGPITLNAAFLYQKAGAVVSSLPGVAAFTREQPAGDAQAGAAGGPGRPCLRCSLWASSAARLRCTRCRSARSQRRQLRDRRSPRRTTRPSARRATRLPTAHRGTHTPTYTHQRIFGLEI